MAYVFYKFYICIFLSVLRNIKYTAYMYDSIKTLKRNFIRGKGTAGVISPLGESDCLDWSNDKDDALGLA